jgi:hypothetical protein
MVVGVKEAWRHWQKRCQQRWQRQLETVVD